MFLKRRILITTALLVLLASMLVAGCGSDSSTTQSGSASPDKNTLSPDGVAMVNGKELTKADLATAVKNYKISIQPQTEGGRSTVMIDGQERDATTVSNAELEKIVVPQMVAGEVVKLEAQKMGLTASEAEINELLNNSDPYAYTGAKTKDAARDAVIAKKMFNEVTKNIPVKLPATTEADAQVVMDAYGKWLTEAKGRYEIIYADQYKPTTTTTSTTP